ncbi:ribbon-helix-helix domain-containing protein [Solibacillus isronensis]|uniref:ribbon-helix-helix domain-containing protein n=1 Tax=Solibacillus isronensis TaxID=412383 RepID=UPI0039A144C3
MTKKRMTFTLDETLLEELKQLSEQTMIPQARIVEQAIKDKIEEMKDDRQK